MNTLKAEKRSMSVKAKALRREGFVVGNIIGREIEGSIPVKMNQKDVSKIMAKEQKGSQIILDVDGESYNVLIKDIQYGAYAKTINEIDFQQLVANEKIHSVAEVVLVGADRIVSGVLQESLEEISYKAYPSALVSKVKINVGQMKVGDIIRVKDLDIAKDKDIDLITDPEAIVASVFVAKNEEIPEEEASTDSATA